MDKKYTFEEFKELIATLRGENGCPWDREQTYQTMKSNVLEESYEVIDACETGGMKLADELGDLLLQVVMLSQIASEAEEFTMDDVIDCISKKMIHRHPHVFGDVKADTSEEVLKNWDKIKREDKKDSSVTKSLMDITKTLPSVLKAHKVQSRAAKVGFDWDNTKDVIEKVKEEVSELESAYNASDERNIHEELGDVMFSVINLSRFLKVNPEIALNDSTEKFIRRFEKIEIEAKKQGKNIEEMSFEEMDAIWDQVKINENGCF